MKKFQFIIGLLISSLLVGSFAFAQELLPNDPYYSRQWYLEKLNLPQIWAQETGSKNVIIAVIDSGIDVSHPDLHDNIWVNQKEILGDGIDNDHNGYIDDISGWDFINNSNDPSPKYDVSCLQNNTCTEDGIFHGTFVAGVAAAVGNNGIGTTGVAWNVKIMPLRVLNENGSGNTVDVVKAIEYAINNGANIINLSFVGDTYDLALEQALVNAYQKGLVIVAASGNENQAGQAINLDLTKMYPVCHQGPGGQRILLGVGATDIFKKITEFSNYGSSCVDIMAPGRDFFGTLVYNPQVSSFNQYYGGNFSGTSLAAPVVSGVAALIKSYKPELTNQQIMDAINKNAENIDALNPAFVGKMGNGLIDPVKIFQNLKMSVINSQLIKGSTAAIYYLGSDGKRYTFPDQKVFFSWYDSFKGIKQISDRELSDFTLGGIVTYRPGAMVKIQTDPKVYAVTQGGILRWIKNETIVQALYGNVWAQLIFDVPDSYFAIYKIGADINSALDFNPVIEKNNVPSIDIDKSL
ncbi:MAG: S8 family peptidase [Patescibacteria group bacterium]